MNQPAFPQYQPHPDPFSHGMTLRDYFAAKAMQGFISGSMADGTNFALGDEKTAAKFSYLMADAMLEARK